MTAGAGMLAAAVSATGAWAAGPARPFTIDVPEDDLQDLKRRLNATRWPDFIPGSGWDYGASVEYLRDLTDYWANGYDWRAEEARLNGFANFKAEVDGIDIHFVHEKGRKAGSIPILMMHGWPSSYMQFLPLVPRLTDPAAHGAPDAPSFDVVIASLPGYGFSGIPLEPGFAAYEMAKRMTRLMTEVLGYDRYGLRGNDVGGSVIHQMSLSAPEHIIGAHVSSTLRGVNYLYPDPPSDVVRDYLRREAQWGAAEQAYARLHATKPQTLAIGMNDSPAGLASWIVEKFHKWADTGGDIESVFGRDELLTHLSIYWFTGTFASSVRLYYEFGRGETLRGRQEVPTAVLLGEKDMVPTPREISEAVYNLKRWNMSPRGGHFLDWEQPDVVAADIQAFFSEL